MTSRQKRARFGQNATMAGRDARDCSNAVLSPRFITCSRLASTGGRRNETVWQLYAKLTNSVKYEFISPRNSLIIVTICFGSIVYEATHCDNANRLIYFTTNNVFSKYRIKVRCTFAIHSLFILSLIWNSKH